LPTLDKRALKRALVRAGEAIRSGLSALRFEVSHERLLHGSVLALVAVLAAGIRLLPIRWGAYLSEFDPYWHYHVARHMVNYGFASFFTWHDNMCWYPWGRDVAKSTYPGVPFATATLYLILRALGLPVSLYQVCVFFPILMGTLACIAMYFLGREIGGPKVGLLSAFLLAVSPAHIERTALGFCDDETIGIFCIILFFTFLLRAIDEKRSDAEHLVYSVLAGLSLGCLCASWGASRYPIAISAVLALVLVALGRYRPRLLSAYSISFGLALFVAAHVPRLGLKFLWEASTAPILIAIAVLALAELVRHVEERRNKAIVIGVALAAIGVSAYLMYHYGLIKLPARKFISVLNPMARKELQLFQSVAEHRPSTWAILFYEFGGGLLFALAGLFFAVREPTDNNIALAIFGISSIYAAASLVRLTILMAVPTCILWALALDRLARPLVRVMEEAEEAFVRREEHAGKGLAGFGFPVLFLITLLSVSGAIRAADSPVTIASASLPLKVECEDWIDALGWMKENLPEDAVVVSWWDYGYWIRIIANRTTLADNGTINMTQIKLIALMFLSNETEAINILAEKLHRPTHLVIFVTFDRYGRDAGYGDENKAHWMCRIAGLDEDKFWDEHGRWTEEGKNTLIYKLIDWVKANVTERAYTPLDHFRLLYVSRPGAEPTGNMYAKVAVFEIIYEAG